VTGSKTKPYVAPDGALATTYWNRRMLDGPMISTEDGVLLRPNIATYPSENIRLASGSSIIAERIALSGAFTVDIWYDQANMWASLGFSGADGSSVRYERL
jgi:hypothetical protein